MDSRSSIIAKAQRDGHSGETTSLTPIEPGGHVGEKGAPVGYKDMEPPPQAPGGVSSKLGVTWKKSSGVKDGTALQHTPARPAPPFKISEDTTEHRCGHEKIRESGGPESGLEGRQGVGSGSMEISRNMNLSGGLRLKQGSGWPGWSRALWRRR